LTAGLVNNVSIRIEPSSPEAQDRPPETATSPLDKLIVVELVGF
jgi:hypothetical protein